MVSNCCETGCFLGSPGSAPTIEIFTHFQTLKQANAVEFSTILLRPASRGSVGISPLSPWGKPCIHPNYFAQPADLEQLHQGLQSTLAIANSKAMQRYGLSASPEIVEPGWIQQHATTYYHPVGTCRMGGDNDGVVNERLSVHGVKGLWVADNSILPLIPGGHPAISAMLIGTRAAEWIASTSAAT